MTQPTVWTVTYPPEPGPEVTTVRDNDQDLWVRNFDGWSMWPVVSNSDVRSWHQLFEFGPELTDATHEPAEENTDADT